VRQPWLRMHVRQCRRRLRLNDPDVLSGEFRFGEFGDGSLRAISCHGAPVGKDWPIEVETQQNGCCSVPSAGDNLLQQLQSRRASLPSGAEIRSMVLIRVREDLLVVSQRETRRCVPDEDADNDCPNWR
jgi:hypothetical protein